jgi:hypothetical protein
VMPQPFVVALDEEMLPATIAADDDDDADERVPIRSAPPLLVAMPLPPAASSPPSAAPPKAASESPVEPTNDPTDELSLLEFAYVSAEIRLRPEESEAIFARYGLADPEKRAAVNAAWQARLQRAPDELTQFMAIYARVVRGPR